MAGNPPSVNVDIALLKVAVATLQSEITALQQRAGRDEQKILILQSELAKVKKG